MRIRYTIIHEYPVKARKGEPRELGGCLRHSVTGHAQTLAEARREAAGAASAMAGYGGYHVETRFYDAAAFYANPLMAEPIHVDGAQ